MKSCPVRHCVDYWPSLRFGGGLLGGLLLLGGCWQEIRYEPSSEQVAQSDLKSAPSVADDTETAGVFSPLNELDTPQNVTFDSGEKSPVDNSLNEEQSESQVDAEEPSTLEKNLSKDESDTSFDELFGEVDKQTEPETSTLPLASVEEESSSTSLREERPTESTDTLNELFGTDEVTSSEPAEDSLQEEMAENAEALSAEEPESNEAPQSPPDSTSPSELAMTERLYPSRTALAAWRMASRWSLAAALYAKGVDESAFQPNWDQATYAAELLELKLPPLPEAAGDLQTEVITYLMRQGREQLALPLAEKFSAQYPALVELAVKSNILLLVYTPKSDQLEPLISDIEHAAVASGLPEELWRKLASQLESRAEFEDVKKGVLKLHAAVTDYLAGQPTIEMTAPQADEP